MLINFIQTFTDKRLISINNSNKKYGVYTACQHDALLDMNIYALLCLHEK